MTISRETSELYHFLQLFIKESEFNNQLIQAKLNLEVEGIEASKAQDA